MPESSSTLWWTITGVLVASVIVVVVFAVFHSLPEDITATMKTAVDTGANNVTAQMDRFRDSSTIVFGSGLPFLE